MGKSKRIERKCVKLMPRQRPSGELGGEQISAMYGHTARASSPKALELNLLLEDVSKFYVG